MSAGEPAWLENAILIYGPRKAGTTLYQNLLDGTPGLAAYPVEMKLKFFVRQPPDTPIPVKDYLARSKLKELMHEGFTEADYTAAWRDVADESLPLKSLIAHDLTALARARPEMAAAAQWSAKEVGGDTRRIITAWRKMFPQGKVLFIVRDPLMVTRAVLNDRRRKHRRLPFWQIMRETFDPMRVVSAQLALSGNPDVMTIAYEDLVSDTEGVMRAVARFAGLPFTTVMLQPTLLGEGTVVRTASQKTESVFRSEASWSEGLTLREKIIVALTHAVFGLLPAFRVDRRRLEKIVEASRATPLNDL